MAVDHVSETQELRNYLHITLLFIVTLLFIDVTLKIDLKGRLSLHV